MPTLFDIPGPWTVTSPARPGKVYDAAVPGVVHYDLMAAGDLANPFASSDAARAAHWVSRAEWTYEARFPKPATPAGTVAWEIQLDGVDTFSEVTLNGRVLGRTSNALHAWRLPIPEAVLRDDNTLQVMVFPHEEMVEDKIDEARRRLHHEGGIEGLLGKSLIRRYQRSFFTESSLLNLGTGVLGLGLNRPVYLRAVPAFDIAGFCPVTTRIDPDGTAHLDFVVDVEAAPSGVGGGPGTPAALTLEVALTPPGEPTGPGGPSPVRARATVAAPADTTSATLNLAVPHAELWWPRRHGRQPLYTAKLKLSAEGLPDVTLERPIGIRTVELTRDAQTGREGFELLVNNRPIYVLGANYIPVDYLKVHGSEQDYSRVFDLLENGNNNLVRMWGGGAPESHAFYDECDRRGIMLWQDCYLHSNVYPDYDPEWVASFMEECRQIALDTRQHPCLVMIAGGNEQYEGWDEWQWKDTMDHFYGERLVQESIPALLEQIPTGVPYIVNTPHGGLFSQSPVQGESHTWGNFFNATKDPVFVTETCWGMDSHSRPETLREVMGLDVDALVGPTWTAEWKKRTSLDEVHRFPYTGYHNTGGLRPYLLGLEVEQAEADHQALKHFRLRSPSNRGIVYWSFNKGGPLFQFGAVDYRLRPLMSHYVVSRLYRPVVVGVYRDLDDVCVVGSNASPEPASGVLTVVHLDGEGQVKARWEDDVTLPDGSPVRLRSLPDLYKSVKDRLTESVMVKLDVDGATVSEDRLIFCPLAEFRPVRPALDWAVAKVAVNEWSLTVTARGGVAKAVHLEDDAFLLYEDNYFPLSDGQSRTLSVILSGVEGHPVIRLSQLDHPTPERIALP
ncbi:MAG: hypothetical protein LBS56_11020 [Propionibacteriaceae bacterium]|jgi:beta-mannosidase|nr:hypothetical protein [Propionibacteriaceae bacterium]